MCVCVCYVWTKTIILQILENLIIRTFDDYHYLVLNRAKLYLQHI